MKPCKGTGIAKNSGCNETVYNPFKFGLCKPCYAKWLFNTPNGKAYMEKIRLKAHKKTDEKVQRALSELYKNPRKKKLKLEEMSFRELKIRTQYICNEYIRTRDRINHGISISSERPINDAGHFFSVGGNEALRYSPQNIHGQDRHDNAYKGGNLVEYEKGLVLRYGKFYVQELYDLKEKYSKIKYLDRDKVLRINKLYKYLLKKAIWVYSHSDFENFLELTKT